MANEPRLQIQPSPDDAASQGASSRSAFQKKDHHSHSPDQLSLAKVYEMFRRHFAIFLCVFGLGSASVTALHVLMPSYRARSTIVMQAAINNPLQSLSTRLGGFSGFDVDGREVDRYLARLRVFSFFQQLAIKLKANPGLSNLSENLLYRSKPLKTAVRDYFGKRQNRPISDLSEDDVASRLSDIVSFSKDGIDTVSIHIFAIDKELTLKLTQMVTAATVDALIAYEVQDLDDSDYYLKMQAQKAQDTIRNTENEIADFKREKRLFSMNTAFDYSAQRSGEIKRELDEIETQLRRNASDEKMLKTQRELEPSTPEDDNYKFSLKRKLASIESDSGALKMRRDLLSKTLNALYQTVDSHSEQRIAELRGKVDLESSLFQELKKHDFQMEMRRISAKNKFKILETARESSILPSESISTKLAVVFIISILLSLSFAYLVEKAFPLVRGLADLQNLGFLVLGEIPNGATKKSIFFFRKNKAKASEETFTPFMQEEISNAVLHIRGRILRHTDSNSMAQRGKIVIVSSTEEGEGKSFTASRLASALADARHKVLLIDGDLRSPALTERLKSLQKDGLTEVLVKPENFGKARVSLEPGVDFLPAGKKHEGATRVISSIEFERLVKNLASIYDFVVIDTPPLDVASDSAIISRFADVPIIVVASNQVYHQSLGNSLDKVQSFYSGPIYAILNKTNQGHRYGYFSYGARKKYYASRRPTGPAA
jgi:capsular exopolysaccharide synthesis family protein